MIQIVKSTDQTTHVHIYEIKPQGFVYATYLVNYILIYYMGPQNRALPGYVAV